MVAKPTELPWNPSPEQGGHNWAPALGRAECTFGCGAHGNEDESGEPRTSPLHMCPFNPVAKDKFTYAWGLLPPYSASDGGHAWRYGEDSITCDFCHVRIGYGRGRGHSPERPLPEGICDMSPVWAMRLLHGQIFRPPPTQAPVV